MKGCRNATAGFAISVCLVPVNVTTVECNYVCVFVLGGGMHHVCMHPLILFKDAVSCYGYTGAVVGE